MYGGIDSLSGDATLRRTISKVRLDRIDVRGIGGVAKSAVVIDLILRERVECGRLANTHW